MLMLSKEEALLASERRLVTGEWRSANSGQ